MCEVLESPASDEPALLQSPEFWRSFADGVPDMLLLVNRDARILYVNRAPTGMDRSVMLRSSALNYVPAEARHELGQSLREIFAGAPARMREQPGIHADGTTRWYATHTGPVVMHGEVVAAIVAARDITESKRAQVALADSEARCRTLVEHAPEAIVVFDIDRRRFADANQNACRLFGMPLAMLLESDPVALSPVVQPNGVRSQIAAERNIEEALDGKICSFEWMHRTLGGTDILCEVRLARLPSSEQRLVRGSIIDITERRRIDHQMQQWQKMDALGQLAAGIAHDFNNVLSVVSSAAHLIASAPAIDSAVRNDATTILAETKRGAALTSQLLTFARRQVPPSDVVDVNDVVRDMLRTLRRVIDSRISLVEDPDSKQALVSVNRSQLEQIVMNLVLNGRDAIDGAGTITVSTSRRPLNVHLYVKDTGCGMSEETKRMVLEPFFTTKGDSGGSGLGLAMVHGIVTKAGGAIDIRSAPGKGTSFEIVLPRAGTR